MMSAHAGAGLNAEGAAEQVAVNLPAGCCREEPPPISHVCLHGLRVWQGQGGLAAMPDWGFLIHLQSSAAAY